MPSENRKQRYGRPFPSGDAEIELRLESIEELDRSIDAYRNLKKHEPQLLGATAIVNNFMLQIPETDKILPADWLVGGI